MPLQVLPFGSYPQANRLNSYGIFKEKQSKQYTDLVDCAKEYEAGDWDEADNREIFPVMAVWEHANLKFNILYVTQSEIIAIVGYE